VQDSPTIQRITCSGSLNEIEERVGELPVRVQDLAGVALQRLRAINRP
jgi:hypothetical protein